MRMKAFSDALRVRARRDGNAFVSVAYVPGTGEWQGACRRPDNGSAFAVARADDPVTAMLVAMGEATLIEEDDPCEALL